MTATASNREALPELPNPIGLDGIEFIEYATLRPQALGQALEKMGFRPVARPTMHVSARRPPVTRSSRPWPFGCRMPGQPRPAVCNLGPGKARAMPRPWS